MPKSFLEDLGLTEEDAAEFGVIEPDLSNGYETRPEVIGPLLRVIAAKWETEFAILKAAGKLENEDDPDRV
ncbi:MAG: hypothetical protein OHK0048_26900 [Rhodoferax sp.]